MSDLRSPLYRLEAFGLQNPWVLWSLARGGLSDLCPTCRGTRVEISSPCGWREPSPTLKCPATECRKGKIPAARRAGGRCLCCGGLGRIVDESRRCHLPAGCRACRRVCRPCKGSGLLASDRLRAEDFGDAESRKVALALFPGLDIEDNPRKRRIWREDHR